MDRTAKEASASPPPKTATTEEILQFLEGIVDSLAALEAGQDKLIEAVDEVKADTEELLNSLETISFKVDYPGLGGE